MWPRHNADFSMFRIYAGKDNKPADYSEENIPYKPLYSFPISLKGYEKGDFTMVYGFPGRTQEYLTSYAVDLIQNNQDPVRTDLREKRLAIMEADMKKNDTIRLMYANKYASVANYFKKWRGEMLGLQKSNAIQTKQEFENKFLTLVGNDPAKKEKYTNLFSQFKKTYQDYAPLSKQYDYFTECLLGVDGIRLAANFMPVFAELKKKNEGKDNKYEQRFKEAKPIIPLKNLNKETDHKLCAAMLVRYVKNIDRS
jgi:hypothetical protein